MTIEAMTAAAAPQTQAPAKAPAPTTTTTTTTTTAAAPATGTTKTTNNNEAQKKSNRIQVSNTKKPLFFYVNLAKRYMQQHTEVELSALGMAITTVVTVAEILKNGGFATEKKVLTSTVGMKDEAKGRMVQKARIEIVLTKSEKFDKLMTPNNNNNNNSNSNNNNSNSHNSSNSNSNNSSNNNSERAAAAPDAAAAPKNSDNNKEQNKK